MRQTKHVTYLEDGQELRFHIEQMSAMELIRWCAKLTALLSRSGLDAPAGGDPLDVAKMLHTREKSALLNFLTQLGSDEALELFNDLLACCHHISAPNSMTQLSPELVDGIISDPRTLLKLQGEALMLNLGFMLPEGAAKDLLANPSGFLKSKTLTDTPQNPLL